MECDKYACIRARLEAQIQLLAPGTRNWRYGPDNSNNNKEKIGDESALSLFKAHPSAGLMHPKVTRVNLSRRDWVQIHNFPSVKPISYFCTRWTNIAHFDTQNVMFLSF